MARVRWNNYSLYLRTVTHGRVWYYQAYDANGRRRAGRSTGIGYQPTGNEAKDRRAHERTKREAEDYVRGLESRNELVGEKTPYFSVFASGFWSYDTSSYIKWRSVEGRKPIGRKHAETESSYLKNRIMPYFRDYRLDEITRHHVERWLVELSDDMKPSSVAHCLRNFRTIMGWAKHKGHIRENPCDGVHVADRSQERGILTPEEARRVLRREHWQDVISWALNVTAAASGARLGELQRLTWGDVGDTILLRETKTGDSRVLPTFDSIRRALDEIPHRTGYVFSPDGGASQYPSWDATRLLYRALASAGIDEDERRRRNIVFHSWRVFAETRLRDKGVPDAKIRALLGHKSQRMSDHYTRFRELDLSSLSSPLDS